MFKDILGLSALYGIRETGSSVPVQCLSEQLPHTQYLVLAAPVPYLSRQLPQLGNSFSGSNNLNASTTFPTAFFITGASPRVCAMLAVCYRSCMYRAASLSCSSAASTTCL